MASNGSVSQLYDSFLADHDTARRAGIMESAYHALAAALHCAAELADEARVERIKTLADRLRCSIDLNCPEHHLGTAAAMQRGQVSLFASLAGQAEAITARMRGTRAMTHGRGLQQSSVLEPRNGPRETRL